MQSICTLLPDEFGQRVLEARVIAAEEPAIGAIYDPPFSHITLQLAEEYDWEGLAGALEAFAAKEQPFEAETIGMWIDRNGDFVGLAVLPYASERLRAFHDRLWEATLPYAKGNIRKMDYPETWQPHVTIKRCGNDHEAFGRVMSRLVGRDYRWTFRVDNVSVQHDPGKNSRTHYLRLRYPLGGGENGARQPSDTNATLVDLAQQQDTKGAPVWAATVEPDAGGRLEHRWTAPELVRLMASLACSEMHFSGGRCRVEDGRIVAVEPKTPFPLVG